MCGRICCALAPELIGFACTSGTPGGVIPEWVSTKEDQDKIWPSVNIAPTRHCAILCNGKQVLQKYIQIRFWNLKTNAVLYSLIPNRNMFCNR